MGNTQGSTLLSSRSVFDARDPESTASDITRLGVNDKQHWGCSSTKTGLAKRKDAIGRYETDVKLYEIISFQLRDY